MRVHNAQRDAEEGVFLMFCTLLTRGRNREPRLFVKRTSHTLPEFYR